ncbi:MAG: ProQ/FINO family protein [Candidatus Dechloromonas phosphoritropha]|jgi:ProP effector|nr:osmoprotectant transporter activator [Candidatus Dechloromonas phosphoritropha]MBP8788904.1 osmoprotectant transporter activator [Azonexus sp.]MBP9229300.1 osmoprotectant transporter activator [Azonexus sp.]
MTEAAQKPNSSVDARALLKDLQGRFDVFRNFSPLAIGIDKQLIAQEPELNRRALRLALRSHTMSTRYLKEMQTASARLNLDGSAAGEVTEEARTHSGDLLRERFKKQAEQRKAEQETARAAQEAAQAEQRRLEKLNQLTEKFGRKAN